MPFCDRAVSRESKVFREMTDGTEPPNGSALENLPEGSRVLGPARAGSCPLPVAPGRDERCVWVEVQTEERVGKEK